MPTETIISRIKHKPFKGLDKVGKFNYHSTQWRKVASLHKKLNPMCAIEGCQNPVHTTDHIKAINDGGEPYNMNNLQSLCKRHNASKTGSQRFNR